MTAGSGPSPGVVRPFRSRVVRQEWAAHVVAPMVDALGHGGRPGRAGVPGEAYEDAPPALFVYRMRSGPDEHVGVVADVRLDAFVRGEVRGHESVEPDRVDALVRHHTQGPARSELVALLHTPRPAAARHVDAARRRRPLLHFVGPDGLEHTVWQVVDEQETSALAAALGHGVQYIADGHHRVAARLQAWDLAGRPADAGVLCVLFPMEGLRLSAFHRRVAGPVDAVLLLAAASADFVVREVSAAGQATGARAVRRGALVRPDPPGHPSRGLGRPGRGDPADPRPGTGAGHRRARPPPTRDDPRARPPRGPDGALRRGPRGVVRPAAAAVAQAHRDRGPRRGDPAEDDLLRAQALRGDLPDAPRPALGLRAAST